MLCGEKLIIMYCCENIPWHRCDNWVNNSEMCAHLCEVKKIGEPFLPSWVSVVLFALLLSAYEIELLEFLQLWLARFPLWHAEFHSRSSLILSQNHIFAILPDWNMHPEQDAPCIGRKFDGKDRKQIMWAPLCRYLCRDNLLCKCSRYVLLVCKQPKSGWQGYSPLSKVGLVIAKRQSKRTRLRGSPLHRSWLRTPVRIYSQFKDIFSIPSVS